MAKVRDLAGLKFGKLTALRFAGVTSIRKNALWEFICDCGNHKVISGTLVSQGKTSSCGCGSYCRKKKVDPEVCARHHLYRTYRGGARRRGISWDLPEEIFVSLTKSPCAICGSLPWQTHRFCVSRPTSYFCVYTGIDRIDNDKGYIQGNVRPCCKICNMAKHTLTEDEFQSWLNRIIDFRSNLGQ